MGDEVERAQALAATRLENAVQRVAEAGRDALEAAEPCKPRGDGWIVPQFEIAELREAVAEWKGATEAFLVSLGAKGTEAALAAKGGAK